MSDGATLALAIAALIFVGCCGFWLAIEVIKTVDKHVNPEGRFTIWAIIVIAFLM